jgi:transposase, IS5 family
MGQSSFIDALFPSGFGRNERLERIAKLIDWGRLEAVAGTVRRGEEGRPPYELLAMLKALLLQQWYGLSDPGMEEALLDRISFRRFCGFALDAATPDETTLCRFRNALKEAGLGEMLFAEVLRQLDAAGFVVKAGTLIDATLVRSSARTPPSGSTPKGQESRAAADPDELDASRREPAPVLWLQGASGRRSRIGAGAQPRSHTCEGVRKRSGRWPDRRRRKGDLRCSSWHLI